VSPPTAYQQGAQPKASILSPLRGDLPAASSLQIQGLHFDAKRSLQTLAKNKSFGLDAKALFYSQKE
jgi:hypothetical protein